MELFRKSRFPGPIKLRRSTHLDCGYCGANMPAYDMKRCDICLVDLNTKDPTVLSFIKSKFRLLIQWFTRRTFCQ